MCNAIFLYLLIAKPHEEYFDKQLLSPIDKPPWLSNVCFIISTWR